LAGLLDSPQGTDHGIEQEQQDEHALLIEVQRAVIVRGRWTIDEFPSAGDD